MSYYYALLALVAVSLKYGKHPPSNPVKNDNRKGTWAMNKIVDFFP